MASMLVFHTGDPGSIPGLGTSFHHYARLAHLAERRLSKSKVLSSILKVGTTIQHTNTTIVGDSIMVSIPSCHDGYPGSIPGRRAPLFFANKGRGGEEWGRVGSESFGGEKSAQSWTHDEPTFCQEFSLSLSCQLCRPCTGRE